MTLAVDRAFGSDWADNEEILALVTIATSDGVSSGAVAEASGWGRRAVSRLVARLERDGLVETGPSAADGRVVVIACTEEGARRAEHLRGARGPTSRRPRRHRRRARRRRSRRLRDPLPGGQPLRGAPGDRDGGFARQRARLPQGGVSAATTARGTGPLQSRSMPPASATSSTTPMTAWAAASRRISAADDRDGAGRSAVLGRPFAGAAIRSRRRGCPECTWSRQGRREELRRSGWCPDRDREPGRAIGRALSLRRSWMVRWAGQLAQPALPSPLERSPWPPLFSSSSWRCSPRSPWVPSAVASSVRRSGGRGAWSSACWSSRPVSPSESGSASRQGSCRPAARRTPLRRGSRS
ncbi:MarR family transcriptional regulator [Rathayibacter sp. VKM Ac-2759]|nr:MarR family transcriptional regulator [Rathayibacter sp. VKM Ac-2759]